VEEGVNLEVGKTYVARNGSKWRVLATDRPAADSIVAMEASAGTVVYLFPGGNAYKDVAHHCDLVREDREPREWVIRYEPGDYGLSVGEGPALSREGESVRVREVIEWTP
jgi:hypothetical protein